MLVTDDDLVRRHATGVLGAAGFSVTAGRDLRGRGDGELVMLLLSAPATARVERIRAAAELRPGALLVATMPADAGGAVLRRALRAGAGGIVLDDELGVALAATAHAVAVGQLVVPRALRRQLAPPALSHREKQVMRLVVTGHTNRQIAAELFVAESTVKTHLSSAFTKLDARSRVEASAMILDAEEGYGPSILDISGGVATEDPTIAPR